METITYSKADEKYDIEQYVEAPFFDDAEVTIFADDVRIDGDFDISERGNCLFLQNLHITGKVYNSMDGEGPIFLIVLGNCSAKNVLIDEPLVCVQSDLKVEEGIVASYNHGLLRVRGNVSAKVICAEHEVFISGTIEGVSVDFGGLHVRDESYKATISENSSTSPKEVFIDEVLGDDGRVNGAALRERLETGEAVLRAR